MFYGDQPILIFQKVSWLADPLNHLVGLLVALMVFVLTAVAWPVAAAWRLVGRRSHPSQLISRKASFLAGGLILLNLLVIGLIIPPLVSGSAPLVALPIGWQLAGALVLVSTAGALAVLFCTVRLWQRGAGNIWRRFHYTVVAVAALYFVWFFLQANFVIFRF
jgi:hypothetical protein